MSIEGIKTTIGYARTPGGDREMEDAVVEIDGGEGLVIEAGGREVWLGIDDLTEVLRFYGYTLAEAAQEGK